MQNPDRRKFIKNSTLLTAGLVLGTNDILHAFPNLHNQAKNYTVQQVIDMILKTIPGEPVKNTVDTIKFGNPQQIVTGIVTTMFATDEVIEKAGKLGANFIIAHEPVFYNHVDDTSWLIDDRVYLNKIALLKKYNIAVWRFHDYIHKHVPDGVLTGVIEALQWQRYYNPSNPHMLSVPQDSLQNMINLVKTNLKIDHVKYIGDLSQTCSRIALLPGAYGGMRQIAVLQKDKPDLLIVGELNEWETSEYVRDLRSSGSNTSLIVLGHIVSEEPGLDWLQIWLNKNIPEIKTTHVPSLDAFKWA